MKYYFSIKLFLLNTLSQLHHLKLDGWIYMAFFPKWLILSKTDGIPSQIQPSAIITLWETILISMLFVLSKGNKVPANSLL